MKKIILIFLVFIFILSSCSPITKKEKIESQPKYTYEDIKVEIVELDIKHWFATTHRYKWNIKVYCYIYNLTYSENGSSSGMINAPSFINKKIGDTIKAQIKNTYIKDKLKERNIIKIY